jgi:hypothetical protein
MAELPWVPRFGLHDEADGRIAAALAALARGDTAEAMRLLGGQGRS